MTRGARLEEITVIGGGPAGASTACRLAQAGRSVLLIERNAEADHKVCGEFLSVEAQRYLSHLGLDLDHFGASRIVSVRVISGRTVAEVDLPFTARALSRRVLDEALLRAAASSGARIDRGAPVRRIAPEHADWLVDGGAAGRVRAQALFLATGKHDLRGVRRPVTGTRSDLIGFKMHLMLAASQRIGLDGAVEIALFPGGYSGLQVIEGQTANLCLLVSRSCFEHLGRQWDNLLEHIREHCPHMALRLDGAETALPRPLAIFHIPYGFIHAPHPSESESLFRLGDQCAVIPSFTGDGMSIALHSGLLAASAYLRQGRKSSLFHQRIQDDVRRQIRVASLFHETGRLSRAQTALVRIFQAWPAAMRFVTGWTRLHEAAIQRALAAP
jgi:flavin-dependent dehydrogenase